jgi:hypothetical protein
MGSVVGREGIEPPQSKTADLQSAELTTCSTYPRLGAGAWCVADRAGVYRSHGDASRPPRPPSEPLTRVIYSQYDSYLQWTARLSQPAPG